MDTNEHNNGSSLQELKKQKQALETSRNRLICAVILFGSTPLVLDKLMNHFLSEDASTRAMVVLLVLALLFMGYLIVKTVKLTWTINDVEREIRKCEKPNDNKQ